MKHYMNLILLQPKIWLASFLLFTFFFTLSSFAQEVEKDKSKNAKDNIYNSTKGIDGTTAVNDKITFKDGTNTLLEINSETAGGSLIFPNVGSTLNGTKLYNNGGNLYWGSSQLGLASGGVTSIDDLTDARTNSTNLFLGPGAGVNNNTNNSTAVGINALNKSTGPSNTAVGTVSLEFNTTGGINVAIGTEALRNNIIGSGNIAIGYNAGKNETGSNKLYIENSNSATPLIYGDFTDGSEKVEINGDFHVTGNITTDGSSAADNDWTISGNNIYNANTGNVGIGTSVFLTSEKLHVKHSNAVIRMESSNQDAYMSVYNDAGSGPTYLGYFGAFNGTNDIDIGTSGLGGNLNLVTNALPRFIIAPDGRAGLGSTASNSGLNVKGITGDVIALRVANPSDVSTFQVGNSGHVGLNQWWSNVTMNVRGITGDDWYFRVEDPAGTSLFNVLSSGNVSVTNNLSKGGGSFKIDHPLDPTNKNLYHSFVESPDMMNIYNGNINLDANGEAVVNMADWFEALNMEFRYQLTAIGAPGPNLYIAEKINGNQFRIAGGTAGMEVSWQVTGVRQDAYANENRIKVEEFKKPEEQGKYLHPTAFGQPKEAGVSYANRLKRQEVSTEN